MTGPELGGACEQVNRLTDEEPETDDDTATEWDEMSNFPLEGEEDEE